MGSTELHVSGGLAPLHQVSKTNIWCIHLFNILNGTKGTKNTEQIGCRQMMPISCYHSNKVVTF